MAKTSVYLNEKTKHLIEIYAEFTGGSVSGSIEEIVKNHILSQPFIQSYITRNIEEKTQNA